MSVTPACTSGTTITCADNSTRMNNISTPYNAHTHTDLTRTTNNTWTVGDGLAGNKQFCDSSTNSRCFQHQSVANLWTMQQSGTTYDQLLTATGTAGLSVNAVLLGNGTASLATVSGLGTSAQVLTSNGSGSAPTWQAAPAGFSVKSGSFTRDTSLGSSTQTVSGLGMTPKMVWVSCNQAASSETSWGFSDGTTNGVLLDTNPSVTDTYETSTARAIHDRETGTAEYLGVVNNFVSGAFDVVWTRSGAPTGTLTCVFNAGG